MAERLKTKIVEQEKMVDVVCGPDAYKDLPRLLASTENKQAAGNIWVSSLENLSLKFPIRSCQNQPAQLQRLAGIVKFHLKQILI